jgi:hypothetical protein
MRTALPLLLGFGALSAGFLGGLARADEPCKPVKPCEVPEGAGAPPPAETPADLGAEARQLFELLSCRGPAPAGLDAAKVKAFCAQAGRREEKAKAQRAAIQAALPQPRPEKLPSVVVYPLSGGDLLGALAAYPDARNFTLTARAPAGDPRPATLRDPARLEAFLADAAAAGEPRAALPRLLLALAEDGDEPLGLRYFRVEPGGALHFYGAGELASLGDAAWANCELLFARKAEPARQRVVRLLAADLGDAAAAATPGPLAHLSSKGTFAAVLPSAGALGGDGYGKLRELFQKRAAVVVSR